MILKYSPKFARTYKKLPLGIKKRAEERIEIFKKDPFDPKLKTHKLSGALKGMWAFSIDASYRIIFSFEKGDVVHLHVAGDHGIYM